MEIDGVIFMVVWIAFLGTAIFVFAILAAMKNESETNRETEQLNDLPPSYEEATRNV